MVESWGVHRAPWQQRQEWRGRGWKQGRREGGEDGEEARWTRKYCRRVKRM